MSTQETARQTQRLDKWLWHARIVKTRSLAAQLIIKGKFRVNRGKVRKPAFPVKCGDVITASVSEHIRILQIVSFSERRGQAAEACGLYVDVTPGQGKLPPSEGADNACVARMSDESEWLAKRRSRIIR
jgi:ribosome-associated heat shock protein Hsp15